MWAKWFFLPSFVLPTVAELTINPKEYIMQTLTKSVITRRKNVAKRKGYAFASGTLLGGIIPAITYHVAHYQVQSMPMLWLAVAGGLAYSAPMVAAWFSRYAGTVKAWGFVVSLETALTITNNITAIPALLCLIGLNAWVLGNRINND
jgi:hypothetical protein